MSGKEHMSQMTYPNFPTVLSGQYSLHADVTWGDVKHCVLEW
jgi:hypothetical protein